MSTTTGTRHERAVVPGGARIALILLGAIVLAVVVNAVVAAIAVAAGAPSGYGPLTIPALISMTAVGVLAGWVGWRLVQRRARDPRRVLTVLVQVVVLVSFVPDVLLLVTRFIPGTTTGAVLALMVMHLVVAAVAVPAYRLASPGERTPSA